MRYLAARTNGDGRIEKYQDYPTSEQAAAHITLHGDNNWVVLDNVNSVPIPHIKVVNFEITTDIPAPSVEELKQKALAAEAEKKRLADETDMLTNGTTPEAVAYRNSLT